MFYHELNKLNDVIKGMQDLCVEGGISLKIMARDDYFNFVMTDALSEDFIVNSGLIYKFKEHDVGFLKEIDKKIIAEDRFNFNYFRGNSYDNAYVCKGCVNNIEGFVCRAGDTVDVFCLHSDYLRDEISCYIDE